MPRPRGTLAERFWPKVQKTNDCWIWIGGKDGGGYGGIWHGEKKRLIHATRASWEIHFGPIPAGLHVLHKCDNPPCVNPSHLFIGTPSTNMIDMHAKGRRSRIGMRGESHPFAKITKEQVMAIRADARSQSRIAKDYGISQTTVWEIKAGRTWRHL